MNRIAIILACSLLTTASAATRDMSGRRSAAANRFTVVPLVSDGSLEAPQADAKLVNSWGLAVTPGGAWWVADNRTDFATVYTGEGVPQALVVPLPGGAAPTGIAFNAGLSFVVGNDTTVGPARFLFAAQDGRVYGWSPAVSPPGAPVSLAIDNAPTGAVYTGLTLAATGAGDRLYVADFRNARVDVFDGQLHPVVLAGDAFVDPDIPAGFAPFGIRNLHGRIVVTFAMQDVSGGFVSVFDTDGAFLARIAMHGQLDAPWGLALAPAGFGRFGGDLLVGNFGSGTIAAYRISDDLLAAVPVGVLHEASGRPLVVDGLWAIEFGNGAVASPRDSLFFTAGGKDERHGLFGKIVIQEPRPRR